MGCQGSKDAKETKTKTKTEKNSKKQTGNGVKASTKTTVEAEVIQSTPPTVITEQTLSVANLIEPEAGPKKSEPKPPGKLRKLLSKDRSHSGDDDKNNDPGDKNEQKDGNGSGGKKEEKRQGNKSAKVRPMTSEEVTQKSTLTGGVPGEQLPKSVAYEIDLNAEIPISPSIPDKNDPSNKNTNSGNTNNSNNDQPEAEANKNTSQESTAFFKRLPRRLPKLSSISIGKDLTQEEIEAKQAKAEKKRREHLEKKKAKARKFVTKTENNNSQTATTSETETGDEEPKESKNDTQKNQTIEHISEHSPTPAVPSAPPIESPKETTISTQTEVVEAPKQVRIATPPKSDLSEPPKATEYKKEENSWKDITQIQQIPQIEAI